GFVRWAFPVSHRSRVGSQPARTRRQRREVPRRAAHGPRREQGVEWSARRYYRRDQQRSKNAVRPVSTIRLTRVDGLNRSNPPGHARCPTSVVGNTAIHNRFVANAGDGTPLAVSVSRHERRLLPDTGKPIVRWGRKATGQASA